MSEKSLEPVRRYMTAYQRADFEGGMRFLDPEVTWRAIEGAPDDVGVFQGHEALRDYYRQWSETFEGLRSELMEELIAVGEKIIAVVRAAGRMKGSDTEVEMTLAIVFTVRDGKIVSGREYATRDEALEAAGLSE